MKKIIMILALCLANLATNNYCSEETPELARYHRKLKRLAYKIAEWQEADGPKLPLSGNRSLGKSEGIKAEKGYLTLEELTEMVNPVVIEWIDIYAKQLREERAQKRAGASSSTTSTTCPAKR